MLCLAFASSANATAPTVLTQPYKGASSTGYTFPVLINDAAGASNISTVYLLINTAGFSSFNASCLVELYNSSGVYYVNLMNQAGQVWMTSSALVMFGETYTANPYDWPNAMDSNGNPCVADGTPSTGAASTVAGFNASLLPGWASSHTPAPIPVVFRPWLFWENAMGACFPYTNQSSPPAPSSAQAVNLNWAGPYAPANH